MIEYVLPINKEIEIIIIRRNLKKQKKLNFTQKNIIAGENKTSASILFNEPGIKGILEELLGDFRNIYFGKDGYMRFIEPYDSYLTKPEEAFRIFNKIIRLAIFIESVNIK
jgi:hypothetical protein